MKKKMGKKRKLALLSCMLCVVNVVGMPLSVYAHEKNEGKRPLKQCLNYDYEHNTGHIKKDKERELNKWGIFDEEIIQFDEETIEYVENSEIIYAQSEYIKVDEDGNSSLMTNDEIDSFILEKYPDKVEDKKQKSKGLTNLFEKIGLVPVTVHAASKTNYSASECFKKTVIVTQAQKGVYEAHVTITFTWLTEPKYRMEDTAFVYFEGADIMEDSKNTSCKYYYTYYSRWRRNYGDSWTYFTPETKKEVDYTGDMKGEWAVDFNSGSYAYVIVDLLNDFTYSNDGVLETRYTDHRIVMQMDIKKDESHDLSYVKPQVRYYHQQNRAVSVTPSVSVGTSGGVSFQAELSSTTKNHPMGDVLVLRYNWK